MSDKSREEDAETVPEEDFTDAAEESVCAKWSSLAAPLVPSLLLSREASCTLFCTPWRRNSGWVSRLRTASLHMSRLFEDDLDCQASWAFSFFKSFQSCSQLSAGEVICWTYTFVFVIATMLGASTASSLLGTGFLVQKLYLVGCAQSLVSFVYEVMCLVELGPCLGTKTLARDKARSFVLSAVATCVLPSNVLASHMTACLLFGFVENILKVLFTLPIPSKHVLDNVKEMGLSAASRIVDSVVNFRKGSAKPVAVADLHSV